MDGAAGKPERPGGQVDVVVPPLTGAVNYLGSPLSLTPVSGGLTLTVRESDGPVYLSFAHQNLVYLPLTTKP